MRWGPGDVEVFDLLLKPQWNEILCLSKCQAPQALCVVSMCLLGMGLHGGFMVGAQASVRALFPFSQVSSSLVMILVGSAYVDAVTTIEFSLILI